MKVSDIIGLFLQNLEHFAGAIVMAVLAVFMPQFMEIEKRDVEIIVANFHKFLSDVEAGRPWGEALAGMLTADWNTVEGDTKQLAIDFAESVATALAKVGIIPSN